MRTYFSSMTRPAHLVLRLQKILPALPLEHARDWTAQVFGYHNWYELLTESESPSAPATQEPSYDYLGTPTKKHTQMTMFRKAKLAELVGAPFHPMSDVESGAAPTHVIRTAEDIYSEWIYGDDGKVGRLRLARLGPGTPAFRLMQNNLFENKRIDDDGTISGSHDCNVYAGFPGSAAAKGRAVAKFITKLPKRTTEANRQAIAELMLQPTKKPEVLENFWPGSFTQSHIATLLACDNDNDILGFLTCGFELTASRDGSHSATVLVHKLFVLEKYDDVEDTLNTAASIYLWDPVLHYVWSTIGNVDKRALVKFGYPAGRSAEKASAEKLTELLLELCSLPANTRTPEVKNIRFTSSTLKGLGNNG